MISVFAYSIAALLFLIAACVSFWLLWRGTLYRSVLPFFALGNLALSAWAFLGAVLPPSAIAPGSVFGYAFFLCVLVGVAAQSIGWYRLLFRQN